MREIPDGHRIAISDGEGNLVILDATPGWQVEAGQPVSSFPARAAAGHRETIRSLLPLCATLEPIADNDSELRLYQARQPCRDESWK